MYNAQEKGIKTKKKNNHMPFNKCNLYTLSGYKNKTDGWNIKTLIW